jgi:hypothetical protein
VTCRRKCQAARGNGALCREMCQAEDQLVPFRGWAKGLLQQLQQTCLHGTIWEAP